MSFTIKGLPAEDFSALKDLDEKALKARGVMSVFADARPGYPCRVTLEDAEPGETVYLLNHRSHAVGTPFSSAYAIYVRRNANETAQYRDELPPVFSGRAIALRRFDAGGMLIGADLALGDDVREKIVAALDDERVAYLHAHNAAPGCFAAAITRG